MKTNYVDLHVIVAIKKQCFDVSEIIFKLKKVIFFGGGGGGGLLILKMISVIKNIIFMAFKIITVITLN